MYEDLWCIKKTGDLKPNKQGVLGGMCHTLRQGCPTYGKRASPKPGRQFHVAKSEELQVFGVVIG